METLGPINESARAFLDDLGRRISVLSEWRRHVFIPVYFGYTSFIPLAENTCELQQLVVRLYRTSIADSLDSELVTHKKDSYRQQNVRQRQKLISIIDYDVCILEYLQPF